MRPAMPGIVAPDQAQFYCGDHPPRVMDRRRHRDEPFTPVAVARRIDEAILWLASGNPEQAAINLDIAIKKLRKCP